MRTFFDFRKDKSNDSDDSDDSPSRRKRQKRNCPDSDDEGKQTCKRQWQNDVPTLSFADGAETDDSDGQMPDLESISDDDAQEKKNAPPPPISFTSKKDVHAGTDLKTKETNEKDFEICGKLRQLQYEFGTSGKQLDATLAFINESTTNVGKQRSLAAADLAAADRFFKIKVGNSICLIAMNNWLFAC